MNGFTDRGFSVTEPQYFSKTGVWQVHPGIDLQVAYGEVVKACGAGTVDAVWEDNQLGLCVRLNHEDGYQSLYAGPVSYTHLDVYKRQMVDTIVVGKFLGVKALAGVGSTGSLSFLVLGFCIGVCNGFAIPVAQKFGERDYPGLKRFVVNAILLAVTFSLVITAVVCALCSPLLGWMNTPSDIVDDAYAYIFVIFLGIPVVFIYNVLFSIIRSLGDSRTPVIYLVICSLLNVVLEDVYKRQGADAMVDTPASSTPAFTGVSASVDRSGSDLDLSLIHI